MKRKNITFHTVVILLLTILLVAACGPTTSDPYGNAAAVATNAANAGLSAQSTIEWGTRSVEIAEANGTATQEAQAASTSEALSAKREEAAIELENMKAQLSIEQTRKAGELELQMVQDDHQLAVRASEVQLERKELENQSILKDVQIKETVLGILDYLIWIGVILLVVIFLVAIGWAVDRIRKNGSVKQVATPLGLLFLLFEGNTWRPVYDAPIRVDDPPPPPPPPSPPLEIEGRPQARLASGTRTGTALAPNNNLPADQPIRANGQPIRVVSVTNPNERTTISYTAGQTDPVYLPENPLPGKIALGMSANSGEIAYPFNDLRDMMVGGDKGSGKSSFLKMVAYQAVRQQWETYFVDPEQLTFDPTYWGEVAQSDRQVISLLDFLVNDMFESRFGLYRDATQLINDAYQSGKINNPFTVENLSDYNRAAQMFGLKQLRPCMLLWDEATTNFSNKEILSLLLEYIRRSRKPGVISVLASQSWYSTGPNGVPGAIKQRMKCRVCFKADEQTSQTLLGQGNTSGTLIPDAMKGHAIIKQDNVPGRLQTFLLPSRALFDHINPTKTGNTDGHQWIYLSDNGNNKNGRASIPAIPVPYVGESYRQPTNNDQTQAELDRNYLLQLDPSVFRSRRSVATELTDGLDNKYAYERADTALTMLTTSGDPAWQRQALQLLETIDS